MSAPEADERHLAVIEAVCCLAPKATTQGVVAMLTDPRWRDRRGRKPPVAGRLKHYPASAVHEFVNETVRCGLVERRAGRRREQSGLGLTETGCAALQQPRSRVRPAMEAGDEEAVIGALFAWREEESRRRGVPPRRLIADRLLVRIARLQPYTWSDLLQIPALRRAPGRLADWGESLLDCVYASAPPKGADFVPEDESGIVLGGPLDLALALDDYSEWTAGGPSRSRVGDALRLLVDGKEDWPADVLAAKLARLYETHRGDLPRAEMVQPVVSQAEPRISAAGEALARRVAGLLGIACLEAKEGTREGPRASSALLVAALVRSGQALVAHAAVLRRTGVRTVCAVVAARTGSRAS